MLYDIIPILYQMRNMTEELLWVHHQQKVQLCWGKSTKSRWIVYSHLNTLSAHLIKSIQWKASGKELVRNLLTCRRNTWMYSMFLQCTTRIKCQQSPCGAVKVVPRVVALLNSKYSIAIASERLCMKFGRAQNRALLGLSPVSNCCENMFCLSSKCLLLWCRAQAWNNCRKKEKSAYFVLFNSNFFFKDHRSLSSDLPLVEA